MMLEENEEVLKASLQLSDKALERLQKIKEIVKRPYQSENMDAKRARYEVLTATREEKNGVDHTENWSGERE